MNFTREPIVETVITPKEGYKLVIRSSKAGGNEEFFVDAVEVISFGKTCFFRSLEKPKCFLVPVGDYEVLEVRESRMVLKTTGTDKGIKIGGGRETILKASKEETPVQEVETSAMTEQRADKRREKRRSRKKREKSEQEEVVVAEKDEFDTMQSLVKEKKVEKPSLIPPPSTLISETITRYKNHTQQEEDLGEAKEKRLIPPPPPPLRPDTVGEEKNEEIPF